MHKVYNLYPVGIDGIKVFLVGRIPFFIEEQLNMLGFGTKRISGNNFYETAAKVAEYLNYPQNIMIISGEDYREGLSTCAYAAHSGDVILFSDKDQLPWVTRTVIQITKSPNVFIVGSTYTISEKVEEEIRKLDIQFVDRISGKILMKLLLILQNIKVQMMDLGGEEIIEMVMVLHSHLLIAHLTIPLVPHLDI